MYGSRRYKQARYDTASQGDLVVMLYDGLLRFVRLAAQALRDEDRLSAVDNVGRALNILSYLQATLAADEARQMVANLDRTYALWATTLVRMNLTGDVEAVAAIGVQIEGMADAFRQANQELVGQGRLA